MIVSLSWYPKWQRLWHHKRHWQQYLHCEGWCSDKGRWATHSPCKKLPVNCNWRESAYPWKWRCPAKDRDLDHDSSNEGSRYTRPMYLGLDFLEHHNCLANLKDHCLRIGSQEVPLLKSKGEILPGCCWAVLRCVNSPPFRGFHSC